jgi:hypothetical protein
MTTRWADTPEQFLGYGSVNTFPQQRIMQQLGCNNGNGVFLWWSVSREYKRDKVYSLVESQAGKRGLGGWCEMAASLRAT